MAAKAPSMAVRPAPAAPLPHASEAAGGSKPRGSDGAGSEGADRAPPGLYVVATPIGNLGDITLRALRLLEQADTIACEDTRVSARLLTHFGLRAPLLAYHDHNAARVRPELLRRLLAGQRVALISDAGTPLISDPGFRLVREAVDRGVAVTTLPGASAPLAALVLSGLPCDRFYFGGFLPRTQAARRDALGRIANVPASLVFLESPRRLASSLGDMVSVLGPQREAAVARELTKRFEEVRRGPLARLADRYAAEGPPKGEVVVVVGPPGETAPAAADLEALLRRALGSGSLKEAVAAVAAMTGAPRREVYEKALALKDEGAKKDADGGG